MIKAKKKTKKKFTLKEIELAVDLLSTAGDWYPGGLKELKVNMRIVCWHDH